MEMTDTNRIIYISIFQYFSFIISKSRAVTLVEDLHRLLQQRINCYSVEKLLSPTGYVRLYIAENFSFVLGDEYFRI